MLQRSPTYIGALPDVDRIAVRVNELLPGKPAYVVNRWKSIVFQFVQYRMPARFPDFMRKQLMTMAQRQLPEEYDVIGISVRATTRGTSGCAWRPMATCSALFARATPTW